MSIAIDRRLALCGASLKAQQPIPAPSTNDTRPTLYVPLDDPAYHIIDALLVRGGLPGLSILDRPYTTGAIARALARDSVGQTRTRRALRQALGRVRFFAPAWG